jgi:hypothetical protein
MSFIKVSFVSDPNHYAISQMNSLIDFCKYIPKLKQVTPIEADFLFVHHQQYYKYKNKPCIVVERADSSSVVFTRSLLNEDNVLALFKHTLLKNELQNCPFVLRRYHLSLLEDVYNLGDEKKHLEPIKDFSKIHCKIPIFMRWFRDDMLIPYQNSKNKFKDVLCRANLQKISHVQKHRSDAIRYSGSENGTLPIKDWKNLLHQSKICVCPWGYGEMCYRDYEAMLSGCIMVKPNTDFVKTWPEIYQSNITYVACKLDFSDLADVCENILDNYKNYSDMIESNHKILRKPNFEKMIDEFTFVLRICGIPI